MTWFYRLTTVGMIAASGLLPCQGVALTAAVDCTCLCVPGPGFAAIPMRYVGTSLIRQTSYNSYVSPVTTTVQNINAVLATAEKSLDTRCAIAAGIAQGLTVPGIVPVAGTVGKLCFQTDLDLIAGCTVRLGL